jgi:S1-C subfamily serine protease
MKLPNHLLVSVFSLTLCICPANARQWSNADGSKSFEGVLIGYSGQTVTVFRSDGQKVTFNISILSQRDQEYCHSNGPTLEKIMEQSVERRRFKILSVGQDGVLCQELLPAPPTYNESLQNLDPNDPFYASKLRQQKAAQAGSDFARTMALADAADQLRRERAAAASGWEGELFWVWDNDTSRFADGQIYTSDLYWAGAYSYQTVAGTNSTVRGFAGEIEDALLIWEQRKKQKEAAKNPPEKPQADSSAPRDKSGTAFAITDKGHLVTNAHVIDGAKSLKVMYPGGSIPVKVLTVDEVNDLAILKLEGETTPLALSEASLKAGDEILAAGFPNPELQGTSIKLTRGIISSLKGLKDDTRHFQIDAAVQPGNSGGPMLSKDGKVVGIVVARLGDAAAIRTTGAIPQNVNYAIKLDYLVPLIKSVDGLWELVTAQKEKPDRTAGEKATASTFLLINETNP